ncbi:NADH-quinone oxidoreductase subunit C [Roseomonas haemaphysalidis]|uniref:NADH-quinone oxidoreductase subunit C n=1 Tax=Roseomonas haemaphysalidis TaxID=2768162 RepID=A0ABS3KQU7_9PROT|nr:NADH-quinone oxidoreductase subunit C [Roseomonas haemaphysalidis]MBO1078726.1 NADH-quinone oxidoreductase subunit C [Roseomonas haemaphysalidis]
MAEDLSTETVAAAPLTPLEQLVADVMAAVPAGVISQGRVVRGMEAEIVAARDALPALMTMLRDDPRFAFNLCVDLCGVDWPMRAERFEVVYNLLSMTLNHRLRVIVSTNAETPVPSLVSVWPSVTWYERETWDMYGIVFDGQPDLRRLLTDYGFEGHPLRKDFPLTGFVEVRYDPERQAVVYEPVKLQQDFRNFDFLSPWEGMTTLPGDEKVHLNRITNE